MTMESKAEKVLTELVLMRSQDTDPMGPVADYVSKHMKRLGMDVRRYGKDDKPSFVGEHGKGGVILSGHLDTVPIGTGWTKEQGEMVDGVMYGRGTNDMKGGCAAMLLAAEKLVAAGVPFALCFTTDEETSMDGAGAASKDPAFLKAPAVVVTEATEFDIVVREKGLVQFSITTKGKPAHASMPHLGENAIAKMVSVLSKLEDVYRPPKDPLEQMTLCVDTIRGGTAMNVIPDECVAEVDVRYPPHMSTQAVLELVRRKIGDKGYEVKILHELDPVGTDQDIEAVKVMKDVVGPKAKVLSVPYATEMVMFKGVNKKLMVCGPGESAGCHIPDEKIRVADVAKAADIYAEYCSRMAKG
ncbi:MAG TPA: M20 family metallopeptidase [Thermoplasmata archaeon]|nr:M20 family metallopeptidase [Thermoplasmata archaeon]